MKVFDEKPWWGKFHERSTPTIDLLATAIIPSNGPCPSPPRRRRMSREIIEAECGCQLIIPGDGFTFKSCGKEECDCNDIWDLSDDGGSPLKALKDFMTEH